jgi:hypothetical protein
MASSKNVRRGRPAKETARGADGACAQRRLGDAPERADTSKVESPLLDNAEMAQHDVGPSTPGGAAPVVTIDACLREFEEARKTALARGQAAAAISATKAKAKMAGLSNRAQERPAARAETAKDSYIDAARRIAFLLRLAKNESAGEPPH